MTIRKQPNGKWLCECCPNGRDGKHVRKQFVIRGETIAFENFTMDEVNKKPWLGEKEDQRKLSELIEQWHSLYKQTLAAPKPLVAKLNIICNGLGNPVASELTAGDFTKYHEARLKGKLRNEDGVLMSPIKPLTISLAQRNLSSVFGTLKKLGHCYAPNPLAGLPIFKITEGELAFFAAEEINRLLDAGRDSQSHSLLTVAKICLTTSARWGEAENLQGHQLSKYQITYTKTKGKKNRTVPISQDLYDELPKNRGKLFTPFRKPLSEQALICLRANAPTFCVIHLPAIL